MLLPGQIASLPLSGLGRATSSLLDYVERTHPALLGPSVAHPVRHPGLRFNFASLGDHTGLGPAVQVSRAVGGGMTDARIHAEYQGTTRFYNRSIAGLDTGPASLEYGLEWRPEEQFYGVGLASAREGESDYARQSQWARVGLQHGWDRDSDDSPPRLAVRVWDEERAEVTRTGRDASQVSFEQKFPALATETLDRGVEHAVYGVGLTSDQRRGHPHWSSGWRAEVSAERHDAPIPALAIETGTPRGAQFTRYSVEAETGVSFMRDPRTLRLAMRAVDQRVSAGGDRLLPSDLVTLGGASGLTGYPTGRFHDLDLMLARLSYLLPLVRFAEMDVHSEWGGVYRDLWRDASARSLRSSFGVALRSRTDARVRGALGIDFSREGFQLGYTLGRLP
jgi:hypothetical protein